MTVMFRIRKVVSYLKDTKHKKLYDTFNYGDLDSLGLRYCLFYDTWLCELWWDTLTKRSLFKAYKSIYKEPKTDRIKLREEIRLSMIEDLIEKAIKLDFIAVYNYHGHLKVTPKGREFLRIIYFIEYWAKEFKYVSTILITIIITSLIQYFLLTS